MIIIISLEIQIRSHQVGKFCKCIISSNTSLISYLKIYCAFFHFFSGNKGPYLYTILLMEMNPEEDYALQVIMKLS